MGELRRSSSAKGAANERPLGFRLSGPFLFTTRTRRQCALRHGENGLHRTAESLKRYTPFFYFYVMCFHVFLSFSNGSFAGRFGRPIMSGGLPRVPESLMSDSSNVSNWSSDTS